jgi:hypothetical protein
MSSFPVRIKMREASRSSPICPLRASPSSRSVDLLKYHLSTLLALHKK